MIDQSVFLNKKAAYYTLGCKLNFAETSTIGKMLAEQGIRKVRPGEKADICVINTCSVTELADKKCRQAIRRLAHQHPGAFVVVTGCYAQLKPEEVVHIEGVNLVLGAEQKLDLPSLLERELREGHDKTVGRLTFQGHPGLRALLLGRRPYSSFPEGTRWLRLFLLLLYHSLRPGPQP